MTANKSVDKFMEAALAEAHRAAKMGEVPIGAVCVYQNNIISQAHNLVEKNRDASAHAEMLAMRAAAEQLGNWRLDGVSLYVTLEPCTMCVGAMVLARLSSVCFGAADERQGAVGSLYNLARLDTLPHRIEVRSGVMAQECADVLKGFFLEKRSD